MKNKKTTIAIISVIALVLVIIGVTYAYWLVTKTQTNENKITTGCLDITIDSEANDITLTNQFPLSDEDGLALTPYEFTVTNNCTTSVDYQINLESLDSENLEEISAGSIKIALFKKGTDVTTVTPALLSSYSETTTTVTDALSANKLLIDTLSGKADGSTDNTIIYNLLLWIDADAPISEQSKGFTSKISVTVGQGIKASAMKEGSLAYDILSNYGGANAISTLSAEWIEETYETYLAMAKSTSYYWGTEMNFNETSGKYKLGGTVVQATVEECRNGQKSDGTTITCSYTLRDSTDAEYEYSTGYKVTSLTNSDNADTSSTNYITVQLSHALNSFSNATTSSDAGLYKTVDDLGDSYYFRGAVIDNYVQFGSFESGLYIPNVAEYSHITYTTYEECYSQIEYEAPWTDCQKEPAKDMYWRIVRINGDGTIRMIYDGVEKVENGTAHKATIANSAYNTNYDDTKYAGYTYDTSDTDSTQVDSTVKSAIDTWYVEKLKDNYGKYIADAIFCNDRDITSTSGDFQYFGAYDRLATNKTPTLTCSNKSNRYTVDDTTNGNGYLSYPIGLLTADEAAMAGDEFISRNTSYYLYSGEPSWTMTPFSYYDSNGLGIWSFGDGDFNGDSGDGYSADGGNGVRPVINLRADVTFTGDGSFATPYEIVME